MVVTLTIIKTGYSSINSESNIMKANCTCTLVEDEKFKIIIDTLTAWDGEFLTQGKSIILGFCYLNVVEKFLEFYLFLRFLGKLVSLELFILHFLFKNNDVVIIFSELKNRGIELNDVTHAVGTHGHSDHIGNLNLFKNAVHIVGQSISHKDEYQLYSFDDVCIAFSSL